VDGGVVLKGPRVPRRGMEEEVLRGLPGGARLVEALRRRGLTQQDLAQRIGVSPASITRYCQGAMPTLDRGLAVAKVLGLDPFLLFLPDPEDLSRRQQCFPLWRKWAGEHNLSLWALIEEAVTEYMETTEAAEHDYRPPPAEPMTLMASETFARILKGPWEAQRAACPPASPTSRPIPGPAFRPSRRRASTGAWCPTTRDRL
jgi:transcriptional regulator with XRE-family HTH domain